MHRCGSTKTWSVSPSAVRIACVEQTSMQRLQPACSERECAQIAG